MIQIEVENSTTFRRRIFLHAAQLTVTEPIPLTLTAWKYFDLGPGTRIGTVDGDFQLGVSVSRIVHGVNHQTVFAEASFGDAFRVELTDGNPTLSRARTAAHSLDVSNGTTRPQASSIDVTLYRDYAPLLTREVPPNAEEKFAYPTGFYCYCSMPFNSGEEALALESVVGNVDLRSAGNLRLQVVPNGNMIQWKVNGRIIDVV